MKIYTRTGDDGHTGLLGGPRVAKDHLRPETCGTLDELNAVLGVARAEDLPRDVDELLGRLQHELFAVGAEVASPDPVRTRTRTVKTEHAEALEQAIDDYERQLKPLAEFVLPGGTRAAALLHLARTVCRRAERRLVALGRQSDREISADVSIYLNRLSDLLFVLARAVNAAAGRTDEAWLKNP